MSFAREEDNYNSDEKEFFRNGDLLTCAPGMPRGLSLSSVIKTPIENKMSLDDSPLTSGQVDFDSTDLFDLMDFVGGGSPLVIPAETTTLNEVEVPNESKSTLEEQEPPHVVKEIEDALETPLPQSALKFIAPERFAYAKQLDPASYIGEYKAILPNMAKKVMNLYCH
ncbi:hypothetical protein NECAME_05090 [Necator americanus]|uniref:Uncharacterized protein n=1 Tax=Necator americanus TaxID=51031 RepID=W2SJT2_NECAM|nr:hypothetical protein NECAME_05090 [Necator americanus]ETN69904.1 hypothetical protein NECAME_05090 [Necator americanus]